MWKVSNNGFTYGIQKCIYEPFHKSVFICKFKKNVLAQTLNMGDSYENPKELGLNLSPIGPIQAKL